MKTLMWVCLVFCQALMASGSDDEGTPGSKFSNPSFGCSFSPSGAEGFYVGAPPRGGSFSSQTKLSTHDASTSTLALLAKPGVKEALSSSFVVKVLNNPEVVTLLQNPAVIVLLSDEKARQALSKAAEESARKTNEDMWGME